MLLQGDIEGAGRWADTFTGLPPDLSLLWLEEPQVTRVRVLAARGTDADLHLALQILDVLDEIAERTLKISFKIETPRIARHGTGCRQGREPLGKSRGGRRADTGTRPGAAGWLHPPFRRPGQTYAEDAEPLI